MHIKAESDCKVVLALDEEAARQLFIHLNPKYLPNQCDRIKTAIADALGYRPAEDSDV